MAVAVDELGHGRPARQLRELFLAQAALVGVDRAAGAVATPGEVRLGPRVVEGGVGEKSFVVARELLLVAELRSAEIFLRPVRVVRVAERDVMLRKRGGPAVDDFREPVAA